MTDTGLSTGEAGGLVGVLITAAGMIGAAIAWLFRRSDLAKLTRQEKLDAWSRELAEQEKRLDEGQTAYTTRIENRLGLLEAKDEARDVQMTALRVAFELVSNALRHIDPNNTALHLAHDMLGSAFPLPPETPADMIKSLVNIERSTGGGHA